MAASLRSACNIRMISKAIHKHWMSSTSIINTNVLPERADVIVMGGGIIGCSVAYHIRKFGEAQGKDLSVILLEQGSINCGTTWHAAGIVGKSRATLTETLLSDYGSKLYPQLEEETGLGTGWKQCGSISVARTEDRMIQFRRNQAKMHAFGIAAEIVSPREAKDIWSGFLRIDDIKGAIWLPEDGVATSSDLCSALAKGAKQRGAKIHEHVKVTGIRTDGKRRALSVQMADGHEIACDQLVNCGGQWARQLGQLSRPAVSIPLHSAEHFYIVTKAIEGVPGNLPVMRDPDGYTYTREWSGGLLMGGFEPQCKPCFMSGIPESFEYSLLPEDWDHFQLLMDSALERIPVLETAEVRQMVNGPESFTPDNVYILGRAPELDNYFVAAGFNSSGIASAAGAGRALSEWILSGGPTMDLWSTDIRRFAPFQNNSKFLHDRTLETLGLHYKITWPRFDLQSARGVRRTPLYDLLHKAGAVFGSKLGWERVNYFNTKDTGDDYYTYGRPSWFENVKAEVMATANAVAIFDQSSFGKFIVQGCDAEAAMQRICSADVGKVGKVTYTGMLNTAGGFESDVTVSRLDAQSFLIVCPTAQAVHDFDWIRSQLALDPTGKDEAKRSDNFGYHATITDMTSAFNTLSVMGPRSRELLSTVAPNDNFSNEAFPFGTGRYVDIGYGRVFAVRVTYVGELGWELYIAPEFTVHIYDTLKKAGLPLGLQNAGYYAIESMRLEKGYRAWGHDISSERSPLEAGLRFAVAMKKEVPIAPSLGRRESPSEALSFTGRDALLAQERDGIKRRMVSLTLQGDAAAAGDIMPWGDEAIVRNGKVVGFVSSGTYGFRIGRPICLGYISNEIDGIQCPVDTNFIKSGEYEVDVSGTRVPATVSLGAVYDPKSLRIKS